MGPRILSVGCTLVDPVTSSLSLFSLGHMEYRTGDCVYLPPDTYQFPVKPRPIPKKHRKEAPVRGWYLDYNTASFDVIPPTHLSD